MAVIFYVHWNREELKARLTELRSAGHEVAGHWGSETMAKFSEPYPDAVVISLDRLPSHGRAVAKWIWEPKKRQGIPIVFAGGQPDKVVATMAKFPRAIFCPTEKLPEVLPKILTKSELQRAKSPGVKSTRPRKK